MLQMQPDCSTEESRPSVNGAESVRVRHVGIVVFDGCDLLGASMVAEVLEIANSRTLAASPCATWLTQLVSPSGGWVRGNTLLRVWTLLAGDQHLRQFDTIFIAAGDFAKDEQEIATLIDRARGSGVPVVRLSLPEAMTACNPLSHSSAPGPQRDAARSSAYEGLAAALRLIGRDAPDGLLQYIANQFLASTQLALLQIVADTDSNMPAAKVRKAAQWIEEHCSRPISVADIAGVAAMSERSLLRGFKEHTGVSPSEYLLRARMKAACRLLAETDLSVDRIARRVGMGSADYLSRVFRRSYALSPQEYRQCHLYGHQASAGHRAWQATVDRAEA